MCGRYTLFKEPKELAKRYNLATVPDYKDNYNVAPGQFMPVVKQTQHGVSIELMKWGLIPHWTKSAPRKPQRPSQQSGQPSSNFSSLDVDEATSRSDKITPESAASYSGESSGLRGPNVDPKIGYRLINARADSIFEKPVWKNLILRKRCLIPFNGFYEWQKDQKEQKQPYYIQPKGADISSFAGIWETFKDTESKEWHTYSIITTTPNKEMSAVHDRMPVILEANQESAWLEPTMDNPKDIQAFLRPAKDDYLQIYKVSKDVNSPRNNSKELIYELE